MDLVGGSEVLQTSVAQGGDPGRPVPRLVLVVGDEDRGLARALVDIAQPPSKIFSHFRVQSAEGLVQEQHPRLNRERPRQRHALALSARELGWEALLQPRKLDEVKKLADAPLDLTIRGPPISTARPKPIGDVTGHCEVAEQGVVLKHEADLTLLYRDSGRILSTK